MAPNRERYEQMLRDLDRGYCDATIVRRHGYMLNSVREYRRQWNRDWWAARLKTMTPRSGAEVEQGVNTSKRGT